MKKRYKFQIVNDKCHSIGSRFNKKISYSTNFSEIATLSFHAVKHITTGEGGAILTNNKKLYQKCKLLRSHGIERNKKEYMWKYQINEIGYNYRLTDFQSILGRYQLKELDKKIKKRNLISKFYNLHFRDFKDIAIPQNEKYNLNIPEGDYETLGGFVVANLEEIPSAGEIFIIDNFEIKIVEASKQKIERLELKPLD